MKPKCPTCKKILVKVHVKVWGAKQKAISYQCGSCEYYEFGPESSKKVVEELRKNPLKRKVKLREKPSVEQTVHW